MSKTITTDDGTTLHVVESGLAQGLVLMFCNSLGTDHRMWDGQARRFGGDYRIVRYDRRGHGGSSAPPGPYSFERLGRDALCVLDALEIDKTWFCGLSMGGMTGMWLAANAGERFHGLVLANTGAHMPPREMWAERIDMARAGNLALMVETVLGRWFTADFLETNPDAVEHIRRQYLASSSEGYAACCEAIRDLDQREMIKTIDRPVLVIGGSEDPATTPAHCRLVADSIPGAAYVELAGAAHLSNIERAEAFNEALDGFLRSSRR